MTIEHADGFQDRYERAINRATAWLNEQGRSQSWLADRLGVDRSMLTRFLQRDPRYSPQQGRPRILGILEGIERVCGSEMRHIFLSHRTADKAFVRKLAADIEATEHDGNRLLTWLDEAEIRPGHSIPAMVSHGLEMSRFIGLVMTPRYFEQGTGWTDAECHAALQSDPDNRSRKLIPLLVEDCPYIPALLRHLMMIDFRGDRYKDGLRMLLKVLRDEPLPRPVDLHGQFITSSGSVNRATLMAERAIPDADPDSIQERLYCNLLPVDQIPKYIFVAPIAHRLRKNKRDDSSMPSKSQLRDEIHQLQNEKGAKTWLPAFRLYGDYLVTFHDLESPECILREIVETDGIEPCQPNDFIAEPSQLKLLISLLNMSLNRHLYRQGLRTDGARLDRYFFPPQEGREQIIEWIPAQKRAKRTVTKPYLRNGQRDGWMHHACSIKTVYLASRFYIQLDPTRVLSDDGFHVRGGPDVGRIVVRWLGQERNMHVLYNVRFWTFILHKGPGPIVVTAGDQRMQVAKIPAFVQQMGGIANDQRDLMGYLDEEAPLIAAEEDAADYMSLDDPEIADSLESDDTEETDGI
jgi:TIR domain-containing protein